MSCFGLGKPQSLTRKAWRKLTSKIRRPKPQLDRVLTGRRSRRSTCRAAGVDRFHTTTRWQLHNHHVQSSYALVYVDEFYGQAVQTQVYVEEAEAEDQKVDGKKDKDGLLDAFAGAGSSAETTASNIVGVDEKAELFIRKFKEEKRLERQRSFEEYQQMLARGLYI